MAIYTYARTTNDCRYHAEQHWWLNTTFDECVAQVMAGEFYLARTEYQLSDYIGLVQTGALVVIAVGVAYLAAKLLRTG